MAESESKNRSTLTRVHVFYDIGARSVHIVFPTTAMSFPLLNRGHYLANPAGMPSIENRQWPGGFHLNVLKTPDGSYCGIVGGNLGQVVGFDAFLRGASKEVPYVGEFEAIGMPFDVKVGEADLEAGFLLAEHNACYSVTCSGRLEPNAAPILFPGALRKLARGYGVVMVSFAPLLALTDSMANREWDNRVMRLISQCKYGVFPFVTMVRIIEVTNLCAYSLARLREYWVYAFDRCLPSATMMERFGQHNWPPEFYTDEELIEEMERQTTAHDKYIDDIRTQVWDTFRAINILDDHEAYEASVHYMEMVRLTTIDSQKLSIADRLEIVVPEDIEIGWSDTLPVVPTQTWAGDTFVSPPRRTIYDDVRATNRYAALVELNMEYEAHLLQAEKENRLHLK